METPEQRIERLWRLRDEAAAEQSRKDKLEGRQYLNSIKTNFVPLSVKRFEEFIISHLTLTSMGDSLTVNRRMYGIVGPDNIRNAICSGITSHGFIVDNFLCCRKFNSDVDIDITFSITLPPRPTTPS